MADAKVTGLDALATVADADILYVVDDVAGTATSKKITRLDLITSAAIGGTVEATTLTDGTMSITGGDITSVGSITATTLTDGTATITAGDISTTGTLGSSTITMTENSDTVAISHDGTDAFMKWSGGAQYFITTEGTNTTSSVYIKGKGTGAAALGLFDGSNTQYFSVFRQENAVCRTTYGTGTTEFVFNEDGADVDFRVESDTIENALLVDGATGDVTGQTIATSNQHREIGLMLALLQNPVAIVGFTGTGADTATENGYESGAGRVWTYHGGLAADKIFKGQTYVYSFDGVDSYLSTPDTDDMSFGDGSNDSAFSVGGWVEVVAGAVNKGVIAKYDATTGSELREYLFRVNNANKLQLIMYDESANASCSRLTDSVLAVGLHYVVVTYDNAGGTGATAANGIAFYVDGVLVASTATNNGSYVAMENTAALTLIGAYIGVGGTATDFQTGDMGRLFVHPAALSAAEVWLQYENTRGNYNV